LQDLLGSGLVEGLYVDGLSLDPRSTRPLPAPQRSLRACVTEAIKAVMRPTTFAQARNGQGSEGFRGGMAVSRANATRGSRCRNSRGGNAGPFPRERRP
jgi:hypothetical protein